MIKLLVCLLLGFWSYAESAITAVNQRDTLTENTRSSVNLMTSDDSTFYMYHIISAPKNGVLTKSLTIMKSGDSARGNWFYYTANPGFTADSFTWTATNNGGTVSNVATFRIKIVPNRTPTVIRGKVAITYRDKIQPFPVTFADPDQAQTYTITILSQPSHGVISAIGGSKPIFRFTPDQNSQLFVGVDSFSWKISDGFSESSPVITELLFRNVNERAGSIVAIMVNDSISSLISNEVNRFKIDLENEGYTTILREVSKSVKAETLWNMLRREYSVPGRFMAGAVLIGKFPTESNSETGEKTDCVYWNMAGPYKNTNTLNIWVSRISTQGLSLPRGRMDEVSRLKEALDANHRYRTGLSRLPHTGYWWALPEFMDCYPKNGATILEMLPDSQFLKPIDAIQKGGELLDETSHTTSHGIGNLWYHPTQIRFALLTSCGQSQNAQEQIFGRGGGCVLSVGATQTTYTGAFQIIDDRSDSVFRFQLANGESFGSALVTQYAFNDRYRAMFYGDLSLRMKMAAANRVPSVSSITANVTAGRAPLTVQFSTSATDPDGDPISVYEWWPENYCGVNEPALSGTTTSLSHVYRVPHLYKAEVLVKDSYGACGWLTKDIAVAPEPGKPLRINCGFPYTGSSTLTSYYVPFGDYVDKDGNTWLHDQSYTNGTWGKIAKDNQLMLSGSVANTEDDSLFLSYARDVSAKTGIEYKIPLPDGAYTLRLGFADMSNSEVGKRIMDISAEGNVLENSFDIVAAFGAKTAGFISKAIELKDGMLDILIKTSASSPSGVSGYAIVNCIEIVPQGSTFSEKSILAEPEFNVHQQLNVLHLSLNNGSKERDDADIAIYSIRGQLLQRIVVNNKILASGIDCGSTWPCGMYYVKARVGKRLFMKSAVLVR